MRRQVGSLGMLVMLVAVAGAGCSSGDDGGDNDAPTRLTCNYQGRDGFAPMCREVKVPRRDLSEQTDLCLEHGGEVLPGPCPSLDRVGCCEHVEQYPQRDCFYTADFDDPASCMNIYDGVWTPR